MLLRPRMIYNRRADSPRARAHSRNSERRPRTASVLVALSLSLLALSCGDANSGSPGDDVGADVGDGSQIVALTFTSDQSVILHGSGQTYDFDVAGLTAASELVAVPGAAWTLSDESAISIDNDGVVTAQSDVGQAIITATWGDFQVSGTAFVAEAGPNTRSVLSSDVTWLTATSLRLAPADAYSDVAVGDILVSGSEAGVLARVLGVEPSGDSIVVSIERATLAEAYARLHVDFVAELTENDTEPLTVGDASSTDSGGSETTQNKMRVAQSALGLSIRCEGGFSGPDVTIVPPSVTVRPTLSFRPTVDIVDSRVNELSLVATAGARVDVVTGSVTVDLVGQLEGECYTELDEFSLPAVLPTPIGPFNLDVSLTPQFGFRGDLTFSGGEITAAGPSYSLRVSKTSGVRYTPAAGFEVIDEEPVFTENYEPPRIDANLQADVSAALTPYVAVQVGVGVGYGAGGPVDLELIEVRFASIEFFVEGALSMDAPFDPDDPTYAGPSWAVTPGIAGEVALEFGGDSAVGWALERIGVPTSTGPLFRLEHRFDPIIESPVPEVEVTLREDSVALLATVPEPFNEGTIDFLAYRDGESTPFDLGAGAVGRATDRFGRALFVWRFDPNRDAGRYDVVARFTHDDVGLPGLPYASDPSTPSSIQIDRPIDPPPPPPEVDPSTTRLTFGGGWVLAVVDGTLYRFSPTCVVNPEACDCDTDPATCTIEPVSDFEGTEVVAVAGTVYSSYANYLVLGADGHVWKAPLPLGCDAPEDCPFGGLEGMGSVEMSYCTDEIYYALSQAGAVMTWGDAHGCTMLARPDCQGELEWPEPAIWEPLTIDGEHCTNGFDDDGDLLVDCDDPACASSWHCTPPPVVTKVRLGVVDGLDGEVGYLLDLERNLWLFGDYLDDSHTELASYPTLVLGPQAENPTAAQNVVDIACQELPFDPDGCLALMESGDLWDPRDPSTWTDRGDEVAILGRNGNFAVNREGFVVPTELGRAAWLSEYLTAAGGIREMDYATALVSDATGSGALVVALLSEEAGADLAVWVGIDRDVFEHCSETSGTLDYRFNGCPRPVLLDVDLD